jgi:uncharacterized protein with GYD domain
MTRYLSLLKFTSQGAQQIGASPDRAAQFRAAAEAAGVVVEDLSWSFGQYDGVLIMKAENEQAALAQIAQLVKAGNVQAESMRLYSAEEVTAIVS